MLFNQDLESNSSHLKADSASTRPLCISTYLMMPPKVITSAHSIVFSRTSKLHNPLATRSMSKNDIPSSATPSAVSVDGVSSSKEQTSRSGVFRCTSCNRKFWVAMDFLWLFMEISSIHGFNHLTTRRRTFWEYVLWLVCIILGAVGAISLGLSTWKRYQDNPTVISMERDFQEWNTSFPTVTICPTIKYENESFQNIVDRLLPGANEEERNRFLLFFDSVAKATYETFGKVINMENPPITAEQFQKVMYNSRLDFNCSVQNSEGAMDPPVIRHLSEMGICYTYNTHMAFYNSPEYWAGKFKLSLPLYTIQGNQLDGDLFSQISDMNSGSQVYIHGPNEVPDSAIRPMMLDNNFYMTLDVIGLSIYSTEETKHLSIRQRKCRFSDESNLKLSNFYTYNLCRMECRMNYALKKCHCVPYFYRNVLKAKVCDAAGMHCLKNYQTALVQLLVDGTDKKYKCDCLPTCDDDNYNVETQSNMPWMLGTSLKWSFSKYPEMRLKRDVIFGFTDLLVSVGGTAGLFLGCSLLSFMEVFYFFTLRLFWFINNKI